MRVCFQHCDSIGLRHRKLHRCRAATSSANTFVYTSVELIDLCPIRLCRTFSGIPAYSMCIAHRNGGTHVGRDRDRERHTVSGSGGNRLPNRSRPFCPSLPQIRAFSVCLFVLFLPFHGDFQCGHHRLQLADEPRASESGNQPVSLLTGGHSSCRPAAFSVRCFRVASCTNGYGGASEKSPCQRQRFVNSRARVPERRQQHLAVKIRHVVEQGADFRRQQVFQEFVLNESHLAEVPALLGSLWRQVMMCCLLVYS